MTTVLLFVVSATNSSRWVVIGIFLLPLGLTQTPRSRLLLRRWWGFIEAQVIDLARPIWKRLLEIDSRPIEILGERVDVWSVEQPAAQSPGRKTELTIAHVIVDLFRVPLSAFIWVAFFPIIAILISLTLLLTFLLGFFASVLFVVATFTSCFRDAYGAMQAMPQNLFKICACIDTFHEPTIIPESYRDRFVLTRLLKPRRFFQRSENSYEIGLPSWLIGRRTLNLFARSLSALSDALVFPFIYSIAILSRLSVKSSVVMYGTIALLWAKQVDESTVLDVLREFAVLLENKLKFFYSIIAIALFVGKCFLRVKLRIFTEAHRSFGDQLDWLIQPTEIPGWQFAAFINAALFCVLFLYSNRVANRWSIQSLELRKVAANMNFIRIASACLTAYTSFCLLALLVRHADLASLFEISPLLPF